jgi:hypothetical protein
MTERIRTTITVPAEVHAVFSRMADAAGISLGRCMGDWLTDTLDGAQFVAQKMEEAKRMPKTVMREFQATASGLHEVITEDLGRLDGLRDAARPHTLDGQTADVASALIARSKRKAPPSSNTGGKVPRAGAQGRGKINGR